MNHKMKTRMVICLAVLTVISVLNSDLLSQKDSDFTSSSSCENEYDFSSCKAWAEIRFPYYTLFNNIWGVQSITDYEQCVFYNRDPEFFGWKWKWPYMGNHVKAYPEIIFGKKPWHDYTTSNYLPAKINSYDIRIQFAFKLTADGIYNTAFVIYLTDSENPSPESITHEIMIWVNNSRMSPGGLFQPYKTVTYSK